MSRRLQRWLYNDIFILYDNFYFPTLDHCSLACDFGPREQEHGPWRLVWRRSRRIPFRDLDSSSAEKIHRLPSGGFYGILRPTLYLVRLYREIYQKSCYSD